ncbi:MAG: MarC family protein [Candidatus Eiseniibacteriota bacterium]
MSQATPFTFGEIFTLLFLTLGPLKIIGPFVSMTKGREGAFKRKAAFLGIAIAALALLAAATVGAKILEKWGISTGALLLTAGIILFLVALRPILEQYAPHDAKPTTPESTGPPPRPMALAFSPLAFPTIVTPYGIAVLILLMTLRWDGATIAPQVIQVAAIVLVLDLLAMLSADRILKTPFVAPVLGVIGIVVGVLQVALGVQAAVSGMRLLGMIGSGG